MIRGPVRPLQREGLWRLVTQQPELFERGLGIVAEGLQLGSDGLGLVDGLMRDAGGRPVLVFASDEHDASLPARVVTAHAFWSRNAGGMGRALPEADLRATLPCRLLVLGSGLSPATLLVLQRLQLAELEVVEVDRFQLAGQERLVVRSVVGAGSPEGVQPGGWQRGSGSVTPAANGLPAIDAAVGDDQRARFAAFDHFLRVLDPEIRIDGDRFSRRAAFAGQPLASCWFAGDRVLAAVHGGASRILDGEAAVRMLGDQIARRYLGLQDGDAVAAAVAIPNSAIRDPAASARGGIEALRASMSAAQLSADECSALGRQPGDGDAQEGAATAT